MKNFTVFDINTGVILRTGCCPAEMVELQAIEPNERVEATNELNVEEEE